MTAVADSRLRVPALCGPLSLTLQAQPLIPSGRTTDMTDWRAVGIGFLVSIIAGLLAFLLPVIGHIGAGLIGGFAAGYVAGGNVWNGLWHGLLAGAIGGVVALLFGGLVTVVGGVGAGPIGGLAGLSVLVLGLLIAFVLALDSAIGGAVGSLLS